MADNNFNPDNDVSQFYKRTNPLSYGPNGMKMKVEKPYCPINEVVGDFVVASGAGTVTFTAGAPTSTYDVMYAQFNVKDENGASGSTTVTGTALSSPVVIDVAALDPNLAWYIQIIFSTSEGLILDCDCKTFGELKVLNAASDPTISVNTVLSQSPVFAAFQADGTTPIGNDVADFSLGSFPALGGLEEVFVILKNTGASVLEITNASASGEIDSITTPVPNYVYIDGDLVFKFLIDTSGAVGTQSVAIELTTNDPTASNFIINAAFDLV